MSFAQSFLNDFLWSRQFVPHGHCYLWNPGLVSLHVLADLLIALSYYAIPIGLLSFIQKRRDVPFPSIFSLFGAFIICCGTTHLLAIWTLWQPSYWLSGSVKAVTAVVSLYTALELVPLIPQALALPNPTQLATANQDLQNQIAERKRAEADLESARQDLEMRVQERTLQLSRINESLQVEITERKRVEQALRQSEERYRSLIEATTQIIWDTNAAGEFVTEQPSWSAFTGQTYPESAGWGWLAAIHPEDQQDTALKWSAAVQQRELYEGELRLQRQDGEYRHMNVRAVPVLEPDGSVREWVGFQTDITPAKQVEAERAQLLAREQLARAEAEAARQQLAAIFETSPMGIALLDQQQRFVAINEALAEINGISRDQHLSHSVPELFAASDPAIVELFQILYATGQPFIAPDMPANVPGREDRRPGFYNVYYLPRTGPNLEVESVLVYVVDVTERKQAEEQIKASLREKEVLLKEVHHRVKNNLQVISSLLNLQSDQIQDSQALEVFKESQNRVRSMALIHEKLYQSKHLASIDFSDYIRSLTDTLLRSYGNSANRIELSMSAGEVLLGIDTAIPLGLIISELVSNALKHAFTEQEPGMIRVGLHNGSNSELMLTVSDNGIGLPKDFDWQNSESLGLRLVNDLAEQLDGSIEFWNGNGTTFKLTFAVHEQ
ncbi:histidine kinase dimerization/phosphoacceptor domain -containing protein [Leptolyngbya sp. FACHB-261]|uniref:histidine kinase dimerization/phosphoacceptor domain -containing protein n=1 Tax=Leptolyngbya sp. FACHB-261 TaxID=2692806 RepID=UPI0016890DAC|nr:histidine kinase dimerization/phosphoacceptor domain -containing protein [Leptolyngbya sp. FACHB-261]MBD2102432.1 PAS domain S-box protein [Leptolyngbya sp. FACHB-261]